MADWHYATLPGSTESYGEHTLALKALLNAKVALS